MRKHKRIFTVLIALILLISGIGVSGTGVTEAAARPKVHSVTSESYAHEDYNQIRGHDAKHPIWSHNSLAVVVTSKNPRFLAEVKNACAAWSPAFKFHDYGYVNLTHKKINTRKDKFPIIYVSQVTLAAEKNAREEGVVSGIDFGHVRRGYFRTSSLYIGIDTKSITYLITLQKKDANKNITYVLEHELGHALGLLRHSTDKKDVMYPYLNEGESGLRPVDLAVVERLYQNTTPLAYPKRLSFINKNNFYLSKQNIVQVASTIDSHLYAVNNNRPSFPCSVGFIFNFYRYRKGHGYKHFKRMKLPNGTYKVRFTNVQAHMPLQNKLQRYHLILSSLENVGNSYVPGTYVHYCHSFTVKPRRSSNTHKFGFTIKVKVRNHHFYVLKK